ncbi:hypothetical protein [Eleftheria terrae]|uniref:hypothetical protein n=1 Tax=Eleftheria terrae TaxID=1597781 RepID=UPI00263B16D2|nr:hypothetical protein [Eleftheria terrae]WKB53728.1 hypothetical protein N7L95_04875 [Eleftheria terrae]
MHAFLHDGTVLRDLGTLGGAGSVGGDANAAGHGVGSSQIKGSSAARAFSYDGETTQNLDLLDATGEGGELTSATAINDRGGIVGYGQIHGRRHAYLQQSIPEPHTDALIWVGWVASRRPPCQAPPLSAFPPSRSGGSGGSTLRGMQAPPAPLPVTAARRRYAGDRAGLPLASAVHPT